MSEKFQLLKVRNLGDTINDTLSFVRLNGKPYGQVILFLILPLAIFSSYFLSFYLNAFRGIIGKTDPYEIQNAIAGKLLYIAVGYVGLLITHICLYLAVVQLFIKYEKTEGRVLEAKDIFAGIRSDFFRLVAFYLVLGFLLFFAVFAVALIGILIGRAIGFGLIALLMLLLIIGSIYVFVAICFAPIIFLRERCGILDAIGRSFYLIKRHWWQTFGLIIILYIIMYFISLIFVVPFYAIFFLGLMHSVNSSIPATFQSSTLGTLSSVFMMCGVTVMSSLVYMGIIVQYYSLVETKDGEDTMRQIENIGTPEAPLA